ncbi:MAG: antibiotic biosynthesis monooxygenase [Pseudomonadales bacterium]|nr:antibiotic biosynthesis monooxygenase [Pseudomonadales bacterium]
MTVGVIARLKIQEGKNEEFETIFAELVAAVRENEAGNNFYALHKADSTNYVVLEQYVDQAALDAHGQTDYFKSIGARLGGCMAGRPEVEYLEGV